MIPRTTPYGLTPFQPALELLVARVSAAPPTGADLKLASAEARELFESIVAGSAPDRTAADEWTCRYDGQRLTAAGPRITALASFEAGSLVSLAIDFPAGSFEWTAEATVTHAHLMDAGGATLARYTFGSDGSIIDENAPPPSPGIEELFGAPPVAAEAEAVPAQPANPPAPEKQWYYVADGKPEGPLPESELRARLVGLSPATLVWNEDLPEWKSAEEAGVATLPPAPAATIAVEPPFPEPKPVLQPEPEPQRWELVLRGSGSAVPWRLAGEMRIGRSPECEIPITDGMASRVHAFIREKSDGYWLADNSSLNGTEVNGTRVVEPVLLTSGDVIRVGDTELVFRAVEQPLATVLRPEAAPAPPPQEPAPAVREPGVGAFFGQPSTPAPEPLRQPEPDPFAALFAEASAPATPEFRPTIQQPRASEPVSDGKFCSDCGGRNRGDSVFCIHCGRRLPG